MTLSAVVFQIVVPFFFTQTIYLEFSMLFMKIWTRILGSIYSLHLCISINTQFYYKFKKKFEYSSKIRTVYCIQLYKVQLLFIRVNKTFQYLYVLKNNIM